MNPIKVIKNSIVKVLLGKSAIPSGLLELHKYFKDYGPINFKSHQEDGLMISVSTNFRYGSIVAHGANERELDTNIKDAILTSFEVPSSYKLEAALKKEGEKKGSYVLA